MVICNDYYHVHYYICLLFIERITNVSTRVNNLINIIYACVLHGTIYSCILLCLGRISRLYLFTRWRVDSTRKVNKLLFGFHYKYTVYCKVNTSCSNLFH